MVDFILLVSTINFAICNCINFQMLSLVHITTSGQRNYILICGSKSVMKDTFSYLCTFLVQYFHKLKVKAETDMLRSFSHMHALIRDLSIFELIKHLDTTHANSCAVVTFGWCFSIKEATQERNCCKWDMSVISSLPITKHHFSHI